MLKGFTDILYGIILYKRDGYTPKITHPKAPVTIPIFILTGIGFTSNSLLALPKNTNQFTFNATESHVPIDVTVSNSAAVSCPPRLTARIIILLEAKPFKNGIPAIDSEAMRKVHAVIGIFFLNPPNSVIFRLPVAIITAPEHIISTPLYRIWLNA